MGGVTAGNGLVEEDMALSMVPEEGVFVGGILALRRKAALARTGVTHIVSVMRFAAEEYGDRDEYEHLAVEIDDLDDENILGEFERTGAFIDDALRNGKHGKPGKVLIHCAMGKSRSATICIAHLLRRYPHHTTNSALSLLRSVRPMAEPNPGFMAQLELYKEMGCPRNIDEHPKYQQWLYQRHVHNALAAGMAPESVRFEDEVSEEGGDAGKRDREKEVELRCRKCRKTLANSHYLISHTPPSSTVPADPTSPPSAANLHTHHFLHPLSWMRPTLSQGLLSGRLECPSLKCGAQIGRYAWQGLKCSCGTWVCPAFSLARGRVDEVASRVVAKAGVSDGFRVARTGGESGAEGRGGSGVVA